MVETVIFGAPSRTIGAVNRLAFGQVLPLASGFVSDIEPIFLLALFSGAEAEFLGEGFDGGRRAEGTDFGVRSGGGDVDGGGATDEVGVVVVLPALVAEGLAGLPAGDLGALVCCVLRGVQVDG